MCAQEIEISQYLIRQEQIIIHGSTNINRFECKLDLNEVIDTFQVEVIEFNGNFNFSGLTLNIPIDDFACNNRIMTAEFRELLRSEVHPYLNLNIEQAEHIDRNKLRMVADLTVSDTRNNELIQDCFIDVSGKELVLGGMHRVYLESYNLEPPRKFLGAVVVRNELDISFEVILEKQK
ncbi:hypothetical protein SAMN04488029_3109 [Reichenbachiella faecimaris]|uniref:YceI-like domain-containing protein n=1 Tax=Reichenbachiella faecimaris TaxID=692418 RepID=A0A1W2GJY6_REIFA|nr:hypothetical protein [Reichenbachiella faecimaris]SMD36864.1 hypothetical protein SAMN04488029_3109 [Reichenbachiella faecimaris]